MKPFELHKAIAGEPLVTRDGRPAKFVAHVPDVKVYSVVAWIGDNWGLDTFTETGLQFDDLDASRDDLFMADLPEIED